jgi:hypothetical protein
MGQQMGHSKVPNLVVEMDLWMAPRRAMSLVYSKEQVRDHQTVLKTVLNSVRQTEYSKARLMVRY